MILNDFYYVWQGDTPPRYTVAALFCTTDTERRTLYTG